MSEKKVPDVGEVVIGTVKKIDKFGAYIILDEYKDADAFVHISEISLRWVRNIRDYLKEGQKAVFKVLRSDPRTLQVDLSLRRVSRKEKEEKILEWRKMQRVKRIVKLLEESTGVSASEIESELLRIAESHGKGVYDLLEELIDESPSWLNDIDAKIRSKLIEIVRQEIKKKVATKKGILVLSCYTSDGVDVIRSACKMAMSLAGKGETVLITTVGSPRYMIKVEAMDEERASQLFNDAVRTCIEYVTSRGGKGELKEE